MSPPGGRGATLIAAVTAERLLEWCGHVGVGGVFDGRHRFELHPSAGGTKFAADRDVHRHADPPKLEQISSSRQEAAHALYVGDHERWPDPSEWEIEASWDMLSMSVDEYRHPGCPDCEDEGYTWSDDAGEEDDGDPCPRCAANGFIDRDLGRHPDAPVADAH